MVLVENRYYNDVGMEYVFLRLGEELEKFGIELRRLRAPIFGYSEEGGVELFGGQPLSGEEVIFWDKDIKLARALEGRGIRLFPNCAETLRVCDDKEETNYVLSRRGIPFIKTLAAPLIFDVNRPMDRDFIDLVIDRLKLPVIVKHNKGSQGKQVFLANNEEELIAINNRLLHIPHHYQEFCGERGSDIRVYIVGERVVGCVKRRNPSSFKSNTFQGGGMEIFPLEEELHRLATTIAGILALSYGSVDFLQTEKGYLFLEANSNAYFRGIEALGINIAKELAAFIANSITNSPKKR